MILKIDRGNNTFTILENVSNLIYPSNNTYIRAIHPDEDLDDYMQSVFNSKRCGPPFRVNQLKTSEVCGVVANLRTMYYGDACKEKFCIKAIEFFSNGEQYWLATEYPVYICSDSGKTIEVIK